MSFLDVFRSPGRRLTHEESADIARRRGLIERESLPDRLKRLRREAEQERKEREVVEALGLLPEALEGIERAVTRGDEWWEFDRTYAQNSALCTLLKSRGLKVRSKGSEGTTRFGWYYRVKLPR